MDEREYMQTLERFARELPKFEDGRINYKDAKAAPVTNIFVRANGKLLLVKRTDKVSNYPGKWHTVAGYLDELVPLRNKVLEELREEIGVHEADVGDMLYGEPVEEADEVLGKQWTIYPVVVKLKGMPELQLNWEHSEYRWVSPSQLADFDTIPDLVLIWNRVSNLQTK